MKKFNIVKSRAAAWAVGLMLGLIGCGPSTADDGYKFLGMSDIHYDVNEAAQKWKYCLYCETTDPLLEVTKTKAKKLIKDQDLDFILVTGDLPGHRDWRARGKQREKIAEMIAGEVHKILGALTDIADDSGVPVIVVPGNNDALAGDYCSFKTGVEVAGLKDKTPFELAPDPSNWPANNGAVIADRSFLEKGYYSIYPKAGSKLRIIVLNTVIFTSDYADTYCDDNYQSDANQQLVWLSTEMAAAKTAGESILLAMHVPAGTDGARSAGFNDMWKSDLNYTGKQLTQYSGRWVQDVFLDLVGQYPKTVTGLLSGHTHLNGIRRIHNCDGEFNELDLSIPGITTDHHNWPGMKVIHLNNENEFTESQTYYATVDQGVSYDWKDKNTFSFAENYPCDHCRTDTLFNRITDMSATQTGRDGVLNDMLGKLMLGSGQTPRNYSFDTAMDAKCKMLNIR